MKSDCHEREKKRARSTSGERPSRDLFLLRLAPRCWQIAASPLTARQSHPLFPRSFQSDFTAKETARSLFENKNLLKNLSSQIFQLSTIFYNNLLSLAWKKLGSYKRVFTVYASESKIEKKPNCTNVALRSQELSRFGGGGTPVNFE